MLGRAARCRKAEVKARKDDKLERRKWVLNSGQVCSWQYINGQRRSNRLVVCKKQEMGDTAAGH